MAPGVSPPQRLIDEEVERLAASDALRRAPTHLRLLRYLVDRRVAGDEAALRETSIALEVFRRDPATYDPQVDPIVRVNIGRLRDRLEAHYASFNAPPKLRIVLPKGRYAPEFLRGPELPAKPTGVAVLRTRNQTGQADLDVWCEALTDRLTDALARAGIARVIASGSARDADAAMGELNAIGGRLGVAWLVESTVTREHDDQLRLTVRLASAADGSVQWVEHRTSPASLRYTLADRLVDVVVLRTGETLAVPIAGAASSATRDSLPVAHRASLDVAKLLLSQRTLVATDEAVAIAERVALACPGAASAWAAVAAAWYSRLSFMDRELGPIVAKIRDAATRATAIDADDPVALRTQAIVVCKYDYAPAEAEALYARALRAVPNYTSARVNLAETLWLQGRFDEALRETNLALVYDPLSAAVRMARALCLRLMRRHAEARHEWLVFNASGDRSFWGPVGLAMNELDAGDFDTAATLLDEAVARFPALPVPFLARALVHAARGEVGRARECERQVIERFPYCSPCSRAFLAATLRDKAGTIELLEAAVTARDMQFLYAGVEPAFAWLAGDPDFLRALRSGGIPAWRGRLAAADK